MLLDPCHTARSRSVCGWASEHRRRPWGRVSTAPMWDPQAQTILRWLRGTGDPGSPSHLLNRRDDSSVDWREV